MKIVIYLQKIGNIDKIIVKRLQKNLKKNLKDYIDSVEVLPNNLNLRESDYVISERQYNGSKLLKHLKKNAIKNKFSSTLGIADVDVFRANFDFVFGIAVIPKSPFKDKPGSALISVTRLREGFYGKPEKKEKKTNKILFEERVLKEALHELGHTFGIEHCDANCVMQFSETRLYVDKKPTKFCKTCQEKLNKLFNLTITS